MDRDRRRELQEQYKNRHPEMGVVCWRSGQRMWVGPSRDTRADYNSTRFQLDLGSWPNRELQQAYSQAPETFEWEVLKVLEYEDPAQDHADDLELLVLMTMDEYPQAKPLRPGRKIR